MPEDETMQEQVRRDVAEANPPNPHWERPEPEPLPSPSERLKVLLGELTHGAKHGAPISHHAVAELSEIIKALGD